MKPRLLPRDADLFGLAEIHATAFAEPWSARAIGELLATPGTCAICTEHGFILIRVASDEAEILTLAVRPEQRRRGTGTALVRAACEEAMVRGAGRIFLEVGVWNTAARGLYDRLGFVPAGERKGYYALGPDEREDALILRNKLPLSPLGKSSRAG